MSEIWTKEEESAHLQRRFDALRDSLPRVSQAQFARDYEMPGGASMITQHLKGTRPIGMEHAIAYAKGFRCSLDEISPRLAKMVIDGQAVLRPATVDEEFKQKVNQLAAILKFVPAELRDKATLAAIAAMSEHLPMSRTVSTDPQPRMT